MKDVLFIVIKVNRIGVFELSLKKIIIKKEIIVYIRIIVFFRLIRENMVLERKIEFLFFF